MLVRANAVGDTLNGEFRGITIFQPIPAEDRVKGNIMAKRRKIPFVLDLRREFAEITAHLAERIRKFVPKGDDVLGGRATVNAVEVGFEYAKSGWLVVVFDTRPDAGPDGEWTSRIDGNELERPHWLEAGESAVLVSLIRLDGTETTLSDEDELGDVLGEMVKAVLLKARADGLFASLPKSPGCELLIENFDGGYGWPEYEALGKENLVLPKASSGR
jgi:hypothetical protein